jgi:DNA-binding NarL/FixJ family response regulator
MCSEKNHIRVILADDQLLFVEMLKTMLENSTADIKVIGICENGKEVVNLALKEKPHVILMDVRMPVMNGIEATRQIKSVEPEIEIMMLTTFDDDIYVSDSIKYGAAGYVLKNILPEELIECIRALRKGTVQISPSIAKNLALKRQNTIPLKSNEFMQRVDTLSNREREILDYIYQTYSNKEISETLYISEQTVKNYISIIYSKLQESNRLKIIRTLNEHNYKPFK